VILFVLWRSRGAILGPIIGGVLVGDGLATPWGFHAVALAGVIAALSIFLLPKSPVHAELEKAQWM
jgi:AAHS family benzoate transporter-like MFS transporter